MVEPNVVEERIRAGLEGVSHVAIRDLTGTKDHYEATIVATAFEGKSRIKQHQLVYGALGELMAGPVHALSLKTFTPETWGSRGE
jgi:stress-induced morphogen